MNIGNRSDSGRKAVTGESTAAYEWRGRTVLDRDGDKVGKIHAIYLEEGSDDPAWALVATGRLGSKSSFIPLRGATPGGDEVSVPVTKDEVKDAPQVEADEDLSPEEEDALYRHYGMERPKRRGAELPSVADASAEERSGAEALERDLGAEELAERSRILRREVSR